MGRVSEWEGRRKDGTVFPFELSLFEFETDSGKRIAGSVRDISERREVERLKNEFISTVSHELRTPLTSIRGSLSLISSGMFGSLPAEALELVGIAQRNSERLIGLINDILDLDRLDAGRMTLEFADVAGGGRARARGGGRGRTWPRSRTCGWWWRPTSARARADAHRLGQVVVNLLSNAVKFSHRGGSVTVTRRRGRGTRRGEGRRPGDAACPRPILASIFERFKQVEGSDAREKGGYRAGAGHLQGDRRAARGPHRRREHGRGGKLLLVPRSRRGGGHSAGWCSWSASTCGATREATALAARHGYDVLVAGLSWPPRAVVLAAREVAVLVLDGSPAELRRRRFPARAACAASAREAARPPGRRRVLGSPELLADDVTVYLTRRLVDGALGEAIDQALLRTAGSRRAPRGRRRGPARRRGPPARAKPAYRSAARGRWRKR
jgi:hypothetical protein